VLSTSLAGGGFLLLAIAIMHGNPYIRLQSKNEMKKISTALLLLFFLFSPSIMAQHLGSLKRQKRTLNCE